MRTRTAEAHHPLSYCTLQPNHLRTKQFNNKPFVHSDTRTNIQTDYDLFFHYQSDELQIFQVGSLRSEQLFGNEVSLVRRKSLQQNHKHRRWI